MMAEPPTEFTVDPDPLPHGNLPRELHVPVAPFRVRSKCQFRLTEEHSDTLAGDLFGCGFFGSGFHASGMLCMDCADVSASRVKKAPSVTDLHKMEKFTVSAPVDH
jgi:hypothetical protein